jgi:predicted RNA binding protein YcfA (HicA-like mRNA interferase family)
MKKFGFIPERQKGSHILLKHPDGRRTTVPKHEIIKEGLLNGILNQINIPKDQFIKEL